jgi:hypothetical protein
MHNTHDPNCPYCNGTGEIKTVAETVNQIIYYECVGNGNMGAIAIRTESTVSMPTDTQLPAEVHKKKYNTQNLLAANEAKKNTHQTFLDRIKVSESGCWEWQHNKDSRGYGQISINGVHWKSHRYSYHYFKGDIGNLNVLHKCDNPSCCNPDHLFLGNQSDNAIDMIKKGRTTVAKTTPEKVLKIRDLFASGLKRKEIAEICEVSRRVVESILSNKSWTHVTKCQKKYIAVNAEEYATTQTNLQVSRALFEKFISRHEAGLLPDAFIYNEIKTFLDGTK